MKKVIIITSSALLFFLISSFTQSTGNGTLFINADNFKNDNGKAIANLFRKGDNVRKKPFMQASGKIVNGKSVIVFNDIVYGDYAVILWHDKNSNGDLDHSWGMPAEPMGCSNGWKFSFFSGMPTFEKLTFEFSAQKPECKIHIK